MSTDTPPAELPATGPAVVAHAAGDLRIEDVPCRAPGPGRGRGRGRLRRHLRLRPALLAARRGGRVDPEGADGAGPRNRRHRGPRRPRTAPARRPAPPVAVHPATPGPGDGARVPGGPAQPVARLHLPRQRRALPAHRRRLQPLRHAAGAGCSGRCPPGWTLRTAALVEPRQRRLARRRPRRRRGGQDRAGDRQRAHRRAGRRRPANAPGAAEIMAVDMHDRPLEIGPAVGADDVLKRRRRRGDRRGARPTSSSSPPAATTAWPPPSEAPSAAAGWSWWGCCPPARSRCPMALAITRELELRGSFRFNDEIDEVIAALADGSLDVDR